MRAPGSIVAPRRVAAIVALATALAVACSTATAPAQAGRRVCGSAGYSYAGYQSPAAAFGVSGRISQSSAPVVENGHVAAWIGVGGAGMGPNGADEWVQVGIAGFPDGHSELYLEYMLPGGGKAVYSNLGRVSTGDAHDVAVVERPGKPNSWRATVDGAKVGPVVVLPGSHGAWRPIATTEAWDGNTGACNRFAYDFGNLAVATQFGGGWQPFGLTRQIQDANYRIATRASGFAASVA